MIAGHEVSVLITNDSRLICGRERKGAFGFLQIYGVIGRWHKVAWRYRREIGKIAGLAEDRCRPERVGRAMRSYCPVGRFVYEKRSLSNLLV